MAETNRGVARQQGINRDLANATMLDSQTRAAEGAANVNLTNTRASLMPAEYFDRNAMGASEMNERNTLLPLRAAGLAESAAMSRRQRQASFGMLAPSEDRPASAVQQSAIASRTGEAPAAAGMPVRPGFLGWLGIR
jgi:hypothetical protein